MRRLIVGISGASGALYGVRLLEVLRAIPDIETHLVLTDVGKFNIKFETERDPEEVMRLADYVHDIGDLAAPISSGSFKTEGMVIAPCSVKTASGIANSYGANLLLRAADVCLKERRRLVLLFRETPLHLGHLEILQKIALLGGIILPPTPGFYHKPKSLDDIVNHSVGKALDLLGIELDLFPRWEGAS